MRLILRRSSAIGNIVTIKGTVCTLTVSDGKQRSRTITVNLPLDRAPRTGMAFIKEVVPATPAIEAVFAGSTNEFQVRLVLKEFESEIWLAVDGIPLLGD